MNISAPFIRRPIGTSLLALGLLIAGIVCYRLLSISALPQVNFPAIFVTASQPGADASTMATTVTAPLERHLGQVPGVDSMRSRSSEGSMFIILFFNGGVNLDQAAQQVQAAINAAQPDLPSGLTSPPTYRKANPNDDPVLQIALTSDTEPLSELYDRASTLIAPRLSQLPGVANVDVSGSAQPAVRVDVNLRALNAMNLSSNDLRNALTAANVTSPLGFLDDGRSTMAVTANDQLHNADDFANLIIAVRNGTPVRLKDVAHVYQGAEDSYQAAWFNGKPSIELDLFKRPDANIIDTVDGIKAALPGVRTLLPPGTKMTPYYDGTPTIRDSVREVQLTLLISLGMVVLTMALFLRRLAPTVIAAIAMPMSLAGAFIAMYLLHFTLDNLSLLALVIAIAFVVDDAIVMIENVIRHVDAGLPPREAALKGASEIGFTIVSITASLVAVFIPLMFASGFIGLFFNEFTITLVAAILVSAVVSLTLTPSLCAVFLRPTAAAKTTRFGHGLERFHEGMLNVYRRSLNWALRHPLLMSLSPLILIFVTVFLFGRIQAGLFPPQDTGLIWARASGGATLSFADMKARQERITQMFLADPAVEYVGANLGSGRRGSSGSFSIQLKPLGKGRRVSTQAVVARLSAKASKFPDLEVRLRAHEDLWSGGGGTSQGAQYSIGLKGNDLKQLQVWLPRLVDQLKKNPIFRDVGSDVDESGLRQNIVIDRATASRLGVTPAAVDDALYNAFGQRQVSTIYSDTSEYQVVVNALPSQTETPAALNQVYVSTTNGTMIPISAVARQEPGLEPTQITHEDQFTTMDLSFNLAPGVGMGEGMAAVRKTISDMRLPGDIQLNLGSNFRRLQQSAASMPLLLLGAILAVYIVLGMLYESLIHPVTIVSTIPSAGTGALAALLLAHMELSIVAMMALVLLIGLVKKNAIMMIDFALVAQREQGMSPRDAIFEACIVRFRPIMMTTMVAILAALPLAIGLGAGAELRRPLGVAVIGGLVISQSLTLLSTPALYLVFTCLSERWKARRARRHERRRQRRLRAAEASR
ncbi:efflux RND transporter permease subunit [Oleiagrimonas soli]|uniref:Acriflavin resistance protein n=1 Tax=Oleiagrimonas soli TaxID=1543381 RepID=A0A099CZG1_9GAMM|nr:efflux RND transporter permease subunit [Oleiagrimonas soli]KGI79036.1 acriflavin resistance protein [Oleiagrimonas soli]MBB6184601.1 multidrug efflux pump [Oleiagrimonas soli]